jgi:hypothetical protein
MAIKQSELLTDAVYARLRDLILSNVLRAGQKLVDRDLAEQLGVCRTPVRDGMHFPGGGTVVRFALNWGLSGKFWLTPIAVVRRDIESLWRRDRNRRRPPFARV